MREAATSGSYVATLAVLNVAEWLYLDRAIRAPATLPQNLIHGEWIVCTTIRIFAISSALRREPDRAAPARPT